MRKYLKKIIPPMTLLMACCLFAILPVQAQEIRGNALAPVEESFEEEEIIIEDYDDEMAEAYLGSYQAYSYGPVSSDFIFPSLNEMEKKIYAALYVNAQDPDADAYIDYNIYSCTAGSKAEAKAMDTVTQTDRMTAAYALLFDHPEIFWSQKLQIMYSYLIKGDQYTVTTKIRFAKNENVRCLQGQEDMERCAEDLLRGIDLTGSDAAVALRIHDALKMAVIYNEDAAGRSDTFDMAHSAYGALVEGSAVCDGYAKAYKYLLDKCGLKASVITSLYHAWNIVELDGEYYETDVTWNDEMDAMDYYDLTTDQIEDGWYHERDLRYTGKYMPLAAGEKYTWDYMSHCGKIYYDAGPDGRPAQLALADGDADSDNWTYDLIGEAGASIRHSIWSASSAAGDIFDIIMEMSKDSLLKLSRVYNVGTGTYEVASRIVYDNGAVSYMHTERPVNGRFHAESVSLAETSVIMEKGSMLELKADIFPKECTDPVIWSSSDRNVATVDQSGLVRALSKGDVFIVLAAGDISVVCHVKVIVPPAALSMPSSMTLTVGGTEKIESRILPADADGTVTWTSSDKKTAAVSSDGTITGMARGSCIITGTIKDTDIKASCRVTVMLPAPASISIKNKRGGMQVIWTAVPGASYYRIYRRIGTGIWAQMAVTDNLTWTDTGVQSGKSREYTVQCLSSDKKTVLSGYGATTAAGVYYAPPAISLSNTRDGIRVKWTAVYGVDAYRIYYESGSKWKKISEVKGTEYTISGLASGTTRRIKVRAVKDGELVSASSNTPSIKYLKAPDVRTLSNISNTKIKITWNRSAGAAKYRVFYKSGSGSWTKLCDTTSASYTWAKAKRGKKYSFRVCCVSGNGKTITSAYGNEMTIRK